MEQQAKEVFSHPVERLVHGIFHFAVMTMMRDKFSRDEKVAVYNHAHAMIDDAIRFVARNPELETDVYTLFMSKQVLHREMVAAGIVPGGDGAECAP